MNDTTQQTFLILGLVIFGLISISIMVFTIIKHSLNTKGVYQVYWTTQKSLFSIKVFKGQFRIKANNLATARQLSAKRLQEKYQSKEWFPDIKFTVRGGGEKSVLEQEEWLLLENVL